MTSEELRQKYLKFFESKGHKIIPSASLVPENDPSVLFTTAGMQPLIPYLLGESHPEGKRLVNSQPCFRAQDIEEVGDNRHTTFFEMLGNWSLGDYFKEKQLPWIFEFLVNDAGIDPNKLYVTVFAGDEKYSLPQDTESAEIWKELFLKNNIHAKEVELDSIENAAEIGTQGGRIFYYNHKKNWWSRSSSIEAMPEGEPGGPNSEIFYEFTQIEHDPKYGKYCHPNCDCGKFLEIGNSVFMQYQKQADGTLKELPNKNVDFGGGLERILAVSKDEPDIFKIDLFSPILETIGQVTSKKYADNLMAFRVIADHLRAVVFILAEKIEPSNVGQGYVLRRLLRRAIRYGKQLGINKSFTASIAETVIDLMKNIYPELEKNKEFILNQISKEEEKFKKTIEEGLKKVQQIFSKKTPITDEKYSQIMQIPDKKEIFRTLYKDQDIFKLGIPLNENEIKNATISGKEAFDLYQTSGFPLEMILELAQEKKLLVNIEEYRAELQKHQELSRTASAGMFKGGLGEQSEITTKYHTATHLLHASLRLVLGNHVQQKGSNITAERLRFDFSHSEKLSAKQIEKVENLVNQKIQENLPVTCEEMDKDSALQNGALGFFTDKYGDIVRVYSISDFSKEVCGGPHVKSTGELGTFKIQKEESAGAGLRRIYANLS